MRPIVPVNAVQAGGMRPEVGVECPRERSIVFVPKGQNNDSQG